MRIVDLLSKESILLNGKPTTKNEAIDMLVDLQVKGGNIADKETYKKGILAREETGSTAIGEGIFTPHAKSEAVKSPSLAAMTVPNGVDCDSDDDEPVNLCFMIAAPNNGDVHLEVLSRLMTFLMDEDFREKLLNAKSKEEFIKTIDDMEKEKYPEESAAVSEKDDSVIRVLCVTACPTGIAHTYMAAEALEKAGKKLGITVKAETNGSGGAKNILTKKEIEECDGIIVAADKTVEMGRFDGKKVIKTKVSDGIKIPEELITKIVNGDAPVYHHSGAKTEEASSDNESFGRKMYKHLMNGVSNMLPFTVAGGIFIAIAFLIDTIAGVPEDMMSSFGSYNTVAAFFKSIGGYAFNFMVPVLAAFIAKSIADRPGFLVGLVGGYLASIGSTFSAVGGDVPSGFLGALLAGFAGGYLMLGIEKLCNGMPKALNGIKPVLIYPLAGLGVIAIIMCAVNPFMGMINTGLTNFLNNMGDGNKVILGCVLGAMMSIDMGGPFNKAAYVFGVATLTGGVSSVIMASVMIGGMIPPIAIALATSVFKNKFTEEERKSGPVNYIMGLSFITEGAIPYAAADPARVIPSCMIGSAIAGGLSSFFDCSLRAPHGGIFVFALVENWPMYIVSIVIGSAVGCLLLRLLKKKVND